MRNNSHPYAEPVGLAHVATVSFLASRLAPLVGFWVALTGGAALARAAQRDGPRVGFGTSIAAMLQTVAIIGPMRFSVPLTQALSAPVIGAMERSFVRRGWQLLACATIRTVHNTVTVAFFIVVLSGGVATYTKTYNAIVDFLGFLPVELPRGEQAALLATAIGLVAWTVVASLVQVLSYHRALRRWQEPERAKPRRPVPDDRAAEMSAIRTFDPRAVVVSAVILFALLIASTAWAVLGSVAVFLAVATTAARPDRAVLRTGAVLAAAVAGGILLFTQIGGIELDESLHRAARAGLLVLTATWMRAATGIEGLHEVSRRTLGRLARVPSLREAASIMDRLDSGRQMRRSAMSALETFNTAELRPLPLLDAALDWAELEAAGFEPLRPAAPKRLRMRVADPVLMVLALSPVAALLI